MTEVIALEGADALVVDMHAVLNVPDNAIVAHYRIGAPFDLDTNVEPRTRLWLRDCALERCAVRIAVKECRRWPGPVSDVATFGFERCVSRVAPQGVEP